MENQLFLSLISLSPLDAYHPNIMHMYLVQPLNPVYKHLARLISGLIPLTKINFLFLTFIYVHIRI